MKLITRNAAFFIAALLFACVLTALLLIYPKGELHLLLNTCHTPWADVFFARYSHFITWAPYVLCLSLILFKAGWAVTAAASLTVSSILTQLIKHIVNAPRPLRWFALNMPDVQLNLVDGVRYAYHFSFPSGHTSAFFVFYFIIALILTDSLPKSPALASALGVCCALLAALGGYSRIYLSMHFTLDVLAGTLVALFSVAVVCLIVQRWTTQPWWQWRLRKKHTFSDDTPAAQ